MLQSLCQNSWTSKCTGKQTIALKMDKIVENLCGLVYFTGKVAWLYLKALVGLIFPTPFKSIKEDIILVTGSANGLGKEICKKLAPSGATLVLWDISKKANEELRFELENLGARQVITDTVDISSRTEIVEAAARIRRTLGSVAMVVNNAAVAHIRPLTQLTATQIQKCYDVNVLSNFWICQEFLPDMMAADKGHIVTICSTMALMGLRGSICYNSSKHAVHGFVDCLKDELHYIRKDHGIKFTTAYPFFIKTKLVQEEYSGLNFKPRFPWLATYMEPEWVAEEIVKAVLQEREYIYLPGIFRLYCAIKFLLLPDVERILHDFGIEEFAYPSKDFVYKSDEVDNTNDHIKLATKFG